MGLMVNLLMPGETLDSRIVVASVWFRDDEREPEATYLLLNATAPYFSVVLASCSIDTGMWTVVTDDKFRNIVEAVAFYEECGGDL
jgi:hypothetical protein